MESVRQLIFVIIINNTDWTRLERASMSSKRSIKQSTNVLKYSPWLRALSVSNIDLEDLGSQQTAGLLGYCPGFASTAAGHRGEGTGVVLLKWFASRAKVHSRSICKPVTQWFHTELS